MNNNEFRKLVLSSTQKADSSTNNDGDSSATKHDQPRPGFAPLNRSGFTRKYDSGYSPRVAEQNRQAQHQKLFKSSTPKGIKLAAGYTDRTHTRHDQDEREAQISALEKLLKDEKIDQATFDRRRDEITGGDISATHLVKGLDFKLLKRVREGEDVFSAGSTNQDKAEEAAQDKPDDSDVDEELDNVLSSEVQAVAREKTVKKGQLSTVAAPGQKRTRNQILADLKAARAAAKAQPADAGVGQRFKKIGAKQMPGSRIEVDSKGREVLIIVDEDGHEKRKVRKAPVGTQDGKAEEEVEVHMMPDPAAKPLGMEVPEAFQKKEEKEEEEDVDIFDDAGSDYDPLAGLASGSGSDSDSDEEGEAKESPDAPAHKPASDPSASSSTPRNYFKDSKTGLASEQSLQAPSWSDPSLQAVLKKAATLQPRSGDGGASDSETSDAEERARREKRRKMLANDDRDAADMDMGFGTSRLEDEEDFDDGGKIRLSKWTDGGGGARDDGDEGEYKERGGKTQRKRGGKKRKGDGNNAADVMRIVEQRRAEGR